jgi:hypothetical protein
MRFATFNQLSLHDLTEMANGTIEDTVNDFDFLQTLADQRCFIVPPWILQASPGGTLRKVARLVYTVDGQLDRSRLLVAVARQLGMIHARFNPRFSF